MGSRVAKKWWEQDIFDLEGMRTASQEAERTDRGGKDGQYRDGDGITRWEDTVEIFILGTYPNAPLAYALGLELQPSIMSMIMGHRYRLEREREM